MSLFQLYLFLVVLPNLHEVAWDAGVILTAALLITAVAFAAMANDDYSAQDEKKAEKLRAIAKRCVRWAAGIGITSAIAFSLSPSNGQVYTLSGAYVATNAVEVGKLPDNLVKAANAWLGEVAAAAEKEKTKKEK